ncbi:hypothetical protein LCGC14_0344280 [marine sediment metagenome]|uniref:Uncharacterized protein n=1 Tax=marine sediment metagenome TaxID=412755 RepID=A0A0F9TVG6_9ZZZZ
MKQGERTIYKVLVGDSKFEVGVNGVTLIEVQPPLVGIDHDDGHALGIFSQNEDIFWYHREAKIIVPALDITDFARVS